MKTSKLNPTNNRKHFLAKGATKVTHKSQTLKVTLALCMREQIIFAKFVARVSLKAKVSGFTNNQFMKN